jgi:hypothetical protein
MAKRTTYTAHELSRQAHEHSLNAYKLAQELVKKGEKPVSSKA